MGKLRFVILLAAMGAVTTSHAIQTPTPSATVAARARTPSSASFDPIGKSFGDLILEGKRAFDAADLDRVIQLMNFALTLEIDRRQAAGATMNRGVAYALKDEPDRAIKDFDAALKLEPRLAEAYHGRALALAKKNELDDALRDLDQAIELNPDKWQLYESRAQVFMARRNWAEALKNIEKAVQLDSNAPAAYGSRATIRVRHGEYTKAIADAEQAIRLDHNIVSAYAARANAYIRLKRYAEAEADLQSLAGVTAKSPGAKFNAIAWLRATCLDPKMRDGKQAVEFGTRACELSHWSNWHDVDTLAAAYAEKGDFDSAVKYQQQTLHLVENSPPPNLSELRDRLALFQKGLPYREELKP